jgi:hypothetical protein
MTTRPWPRLFTDPAPAPSLERAAAALTATDSPPRSSTTPPPRGPHPRPDTGGRQRVHRRSETLRLSGIDADINTSGRYQAIKPRVLAIDRATGAEDIRRLLASPDVAVGSVHAVTETGSLVIASGSGSQLPGYAGDAARAIWIVGAQKVVPDLATALRRVEDHCLPLESARTRVAYGWPSAINRLLILHAEPLSRPRHRPAPPPSHRILKPPGVVAAGRAQSHRRGQVANQWPLP